VDRSAVRANIRAFRKLIGPRVKLWSVVKSNAYGHGLYTFAPLAAKLGVDGFCVDSLVEAVRMREMGLAQPILVLGSTLPELFAVAAGYDITLSVSTPEDLRAFRRAKMRSAFHVKVDTGMNRRGFTEKSFGAALKTLRSPALSGHLSGIYTHFAAAKDVAYPGFAERQYGRFEKMERALRRALPRGRGRGGQALTVHTAATGGTLLNKRYHRDAVRIGIGLYGYHPSAELEAQLPRVVLRPVLSWKAVVSEVKTAEAGEYVGYSFTERLRRRTRLAVLPVGYWHGLPVALSGAGQVLIRGRRARVLGRVSMDLTVVDVTDIACKVGDAVTLIGADGKDMIPAWEFAARIPATHHYEVLTRLNPLMERRVTN
jgi:alanine racemase